MKNQVSPIEEAFCLAVSILVNENGIEVNEAKKIVKQMMNITADLMIKTAQELTKKDSLLQIIEDTEPYNQDEPTQETKPFTKEEQQAFWQAEHELIQQQIYDEAMYFKGKVLDIPNHLR